MVSIGNASFVTGGLNGQPTSCVWTCKVGWHVSDDGLSCEDCFQSNPSQYCGGGMGVAGYALVSVSACHPTSKRSDICKVCVPLAHAMVTGYADGGCAYRCDAGYYMSNGSCVPCSSAPSCSAGESPLITKN